MYTCIYAHRVCVHILINFRIFRKWNSSIRKNELSSSIRQWVNPSFCSSLNLYSIRGVQSHRGVYAALYLPFFTRAGITNRKYNMPPLRSFEIYSFGDDNFIISSTKSSICNDLELWWLLARALASCYENQGSIPAWRILNGLCWWSLIFFRNCLRLALGRRSL